MNIIGKNVVGIIAFLAVFFIVKYAVQEFREQRIVSSIEKEFTQMQDEATEKHPELSTTVALQNEAHKKVKGLLANTKSEREKINRAADMFFGYYFINTRSRNAFCGKRGIDISSFVKLFSALNDQEFKKAKLIYKQAGKNEEKLWSKIESIQYRIVSQDMQDTANFYQITLDDACRFLAKNAADVVPAMRLSKTLPDAHKALMGML